MKRLRLEPYVPAGLEARQELRWIGMGFCLSTLYSLGFLLSLWNRYQALFTRAGKEKVLQEGAVMADFVEILGNGLAGFLMVALCMAALVAYHYFYHYQGGRSIYLMKRLPDRWELFRRCVTLPLLSAAAALLLAGLLLAIYFGIYLLAIPDVCLTPGQWRKIWSAWLGVSLCWN